MSQAAPIVINDASAVAKTFNPESVTPAFSAFADRTTGVSKLFPRLRVSNAFANGKSTISKARFSVELPIAGTDAESNLYLLRVLRANVEYQIPDGATQANIDKLDAFVRNGLSNALIQGAMKNQDPLY